MRAAFGELREVRLVELVDHMAQSLELTVWTTNQMDGGLMRIVIGRRQSEEEEVGQTACLLILAKPQSRRGRIG
jgi:hypothetical protein